MDHPVPFECLVADIAARFANIEASDVDDVIVDSLRQIVFALDLDRSALWQISADGDDVVYTHVWTRPEFPSPPVHVSTRELFPWIHSRILANEPTWNSGGNDVPEGKDRASLLELHTKANAVIPLTVRGRVVGALSFGSLRAERKWPKPVRDRLLLIGSVFAHALALKEARQQLDAAQAAVERLQRERENEPDGASALDEVQARHIRAVLERVGWRVRGAGGAAELLNMKPTTLDSRMAKLGIRRPRG